MNNELKLIWKNEGGESFSIGNLTCKRDKYYFQYNLEEAKRAILEGFKPLDGFPKLDVKYFREELFSTFQKWVRDTDNKDITDIEGLKEININKFSFSSEECLNEKNSCQ